jgi:hypothetical protein
LKSYDLFFSPHPAKPRSLFTGAAPQHYGLECPSSKRTLFLKSSIDSSNIACPLSFEDLEFSVLLRKCFSSFFFGCDILQDRQVYSQAKPLLKPAPFLGPFLGAHLYIFTSEFSGGGIFFWRKASVYYTLLHFLNVVALPSSSAVLNNK